MAKVALDGGVANMTLDEVWLISNVVLDGSVANVALDGGVASVLDGGMANV